MALVIGENPGIKICALKGSCNRTYHCVTSEVDRGWERLLSDHGLQNVTAHSNGGSFRCPGLPSASPQRAQAGDPGSSSSSSHLFVYVREATWGDMEDTVRSQTFE